jgi:hypothetical protein
VSYGHGPSRMHKPDREPTPFQSTRLPFLSRKHPAPSPPTQMGASLTPKPCLLHCTGAGGGSPASAVLPSTKLRFQWDMYDNPDHRGRGWEVTSRCLTTHPGRKCCWTLGLWVLVTLAARAPTPSIRPLQQCCHPQMPQFVSARTAALDSLGTTGCRPFSAASHPPLHTSPKVFHPFPEFRS